MALAHNVWPLREAGMDEAPDQQTAQPNDREDWRARRTMVEHDVLATKALTWTEKGVYIALLSHCYAGKTVCWPSVPTLADHTGLADRVVTRAVGSLARKGWLSRQIGGGTQTTHYILRGNPGTPPDKSSPLTPDASSPHPCPSVTTPLTNRHHTPDKSSYEAVQEKQSKRSSPRNQRESTPHGVGADAPPPAPKARRAVSKEALTAATGADLLIDELREALGCAMIGDKTRAKWAASFRATLSACTPAERSRFVRWLVSSGYWSRETVFMLSGQLEAEAEAWLMAGKPASKPKAQSTGNGTMPAPLPDPDAPPRWIKPDPRIIDRDVDRNNARFIAYWQNPPFLMSEDERAAAGVTAW